MQWQHVHSIPSHQLVVVPLPWGTPHYPHERNIQQLSSECPLDPVAHRLPGLPFSLPLLTYLSRINSSTDIACINQNSPSGAQTTRDKIFLLAILTEAATRRFLVHVVVLNDCVLDFTVISCIIGAQAGPGEPLRLLRPWPEQ